MRNRTVAILLLLLSLLLECAFAQEGARQILSKAYELRDQGDYLSAAALFRSVASKTEDSTTMAESLYGLVDCGDRAAQAVTGTFFSMDTVRGVPRDSLWNAFQTSFEKKADEFRRVGIHLKMVSYFETYCVNADTSTRRLLATRFWKTPWGELAAFDLITGGVTASGYPEFNDPHQVLKNAQRFLERYQTSELKYDVFLILGRAFQDLWGFANGHEKDMLTEEELSNPEKLRKEAIRYLSMVRDNSKQLKKLEWDSFMRGVLRDLTAKQDTHVYFYYGD